MFISMSVIIIIITTTSSIISIVIPMVYYTNPPFGSSRGVGSFRKQHFMEATNEEPMSYFHGPIDTNNLSSGS